MGQKEQLLAGARTCLVERGYAHTTARDIVAASGANLASIGYHFGSKDALLNVAAIELVEEWGDRLADAVEEIGRHAPGERLEQFISGILAADDDQRRVIVATLQAYALAEFAPEVRAQLRGTYERARTDVAALVLGVDRDEVTAERAATVGSASLALINGAVLQWLIDPEAAEGFSRLSGALVALGAASA